jgi:hypothetical protein
VSGVLSLVVHGGIVVTCLVGATPERELIGRSSSREVAEAAIHFELATPAEAAPDPALVPAPFVGPEPAPVAAPPAAVVPRQGHAVRRPRPAPVVPVRIPVVVETITPPELAAESGEEGEDDGEPAPAPAPAASFAAPVPGPAVVAMSVPAPPAARPVAPATEVLQVSPGEATYLRIHEVFPSLPRSLWVSGRVYAVIAQVCVSTEGRVSDVAIKRGAAPELDRAVVASARSWRYRPRLVQGAPRPFCHLIKLEFSLGR